MTAELSLFVDDVERTYILHVPSTPSRATIVGLHGGGSNGREWWSRHWDRHADNGLTIVCPTSACALPGKDSHWRTKGEGTPGVPDNIDERFVAELAARYGVAGRVYAQGFSSGAKLTHHMVRFRPNLLLGAGVTGHGITDAVRTAARAGPTPPIRISFGTKDDNYADPNGNVTDGPETLAHYLDETGGVRPAVRRVEKGLTTTAVTWDYGPDLKYAVVRGMPHRMAKTRLGDPYYETDELIRFWGL